MILLKFLISKFLLFFNLFDLFSMKQNLSQIEFLNWVKNEKINLKEFKINAKK